MKQLLVLAAALLLSCKAVKADDLRWDIAGHHAIQWNNLRGGVPHSDHVEMAGRKVAVVYYWGVDKDQQWTMSRHLVFPCLRTIPDNTHASWMPRCEVDFLKGLTVDGRMVGREKVKSVRLEGILTSVSTINGNGADFEVTRTYFPSTTKQAVCEVYTLRNLSDKDHLLRIPALYQQQATNKGDGTRGSYRLVAKTEFDENQKVTLKPGESYSFTTTVQAYAPSNESELTLNVASELEARQAFIEQVTSGLDFQCPNDTLNTLFALSKVRATESIFETAGGPLHGPGGESYYAAIWANDQAEYINPFFPFIDYAYGSASALNSYQHFARFMNDEMKPIPSSIISEGRSIWNGAGDRGDAAMIAYGASRYVLAKGDRAEAEELWPLIEWCLRYCNGKLTKDGVVASDCDELEHRFPAGDANLCTSSLYYDALVSASYLSKLLGKPGSATYTKQAAALRKAIEKHFGHDMEGFHTYQYYEGNELLRSWICIPLTMGIYDRAAGTIQALLSPHLMSPQGLLTQAKDKTYWDRATLYALRGIFAAGEANTATDFLCNFSATRLLGQHVPYVVEAWPEGSGRHLSAESALYCRIITEGLLGFRPTGFRSFTLTPQMPQGWDTYTLRGVKACTDVPLTITVTRKGAKLEVTVQKDGRQICNSLVRPGAPLTVTVK